MEDGYVLLFEALMERLYKDYKKLCQGKIPECYPHIEREKNKATFIADEKRKIEDMVWNGSCDYLMIDPEEFSKELQRIRRECSLEKLRK